MASAALTKRSLDLADLVDQTVDVTEFRVSRVAFQDISDLISGWSNRSDLLTIAGLKEILTRLWWGRICVLQEVALSKNFYFVCGDRMITRYWCSAVINANYGFWQILVIILDTSGRTRRLI
jgi:hypothetical protein